MQHTSTAREGARDGRVNSMGSNSDIDADGEGPNYVFTMKSTFIGVAGGVRRTDDRYSGPYNLI